MNTLVIIGNGFDLSHGLKIDYGSFLDYMVDEKINNQKSNEPDNPFSNEEKEILENMPPLT